MNRKKTPDKIDFELSRTYFGNTAKEKNVKNHGQDKFRRSSIKNQISGPGRLKFFSITLVIIGSLIFLAVYFLGHKRVIFNISIHIESAPDSHETAVSATTRSGKTAKRTIPAISSEKYGHKALLPKDAFEDEKTLYDFEKNNEGWEIPAWEFEKPDHVARSLRKTGAFASKGSGSIELYAEFPGERWTAALAEIQQYLNLEDYDTVSADIYLPSAAPTGLRGKLILTIGENWQFVEMARSVRLNPGKWTTLTANISDGSTDWKRIKADRDFRKDVRKIAIRIESDRASYSGPVYIDNVRVISRAE